MQIPENNVTNWHAEAKIYRAHLVDTSDEKALDFLIDTIRLIQDVDANKRYNTILFMLIMIVAHQRTALWHYLLGTFTLIPTTKELTSIEMAFMSSTEIILKAQNLRNGRPVPRAKPSTWEDLLSRAQRINNGEFMELTLYGIATIAGTQETSRRAIREVALSWYEDDALRSEPVQTFLLYYAAHMMADDELLERFSAPEGIVEKSYIDHLNGHLVKHCSWKIPIFTDGATIWTGLVYKKPDPE